MNETHNPALRSWVQSANDPECDFPIQNLPLGIFRRRGSKKPARAGVAIGNRILDVAACLREGMFAGRAAEAAACCREPALNELMAAGPEFSSALRLRLSTLLREDTPDLHTHARVDELLPPMDEAEMLLPCRIGDYTDFYASIHHARNVGSIFRPDNPLLPNYRHVPIAYHGRSSSIVASGMPVCRPSGQVLENEADGPVVRPTRLLDYELEVGLFIGSGNALGSPIPVAEAEEHIFGLCLVNDWSARDIQKWEYQPLGPFLAKNFATTVSPWIVTLEALEPYRTALPARPAGDPAPLPYLSTTKGGPGGIDLTLEVYLRSGYMRESKLKPVRLSRGSFRDMYWTPAQLVAHHTCNGCNLRPGDLLASGTVSGEGEDTRGCLLELTDRGRRPLALPGGESRTFLEDGDEVIFHGYCVRQGYRRIGFGTCRGVVVQVPGSGDP